jgi:hypothetical protein
MIGLNRVVFVAGVFVTIGGRIADLRDRQAQLERFICDLAVARGGAATSKK